MQVTEKQYKNFGKCLEITNGNIELVVTLDVGPRILRYALSGGENIFFEDIDRKIVSDDPRIKEVYGKDAVWYIYGGHRLWISPEQGSTYYPDNIPVSYVVEGNTVTFYQGMQEPLQLKGEISLTIAENSTEVTVLHKVTNHGEQTEFAPWALSVLAPGGVEVVPFNDDKTGWLSNRTLMLWDYTEMDDSRVHFGKKYIILKQDKNKDNAFKIGLDNRKGFAAYIKGGTAFVKKFSFDATKRYADNGCNFETYTNALMLECETLGALSTVEKGESVIHTENWSLFSGVEVKDLDDSFGQKIEELIG